MASTLLKNGVGPKRLLKAAERLSLPELDRFVSDLLALRASRRAPRLMATEAELLETINQTLPLSSARRLRVLSQKRRQERLTAKEQCELNELTDQSEWLQVERLRALTQLAEVRKMSLSELMDQLGIQAKIDG